MITITHVTKRFGEVAALDDVSLGIDEGARVAFVGANGSGKTTLMRALLGLVRFDGRITVSGCDVAKEPELALRSVAYIPQISPPIDASVAEVVRAQAALRGKRPEAVWERARHLGLDVDASRGKRFRDLSGGMKQKLLAAMALAAEAMVLVCDEPTANLDGDARLAFFEELSERPRSSVVVLCSHRIEEVRQLVDRVVELRAGKIARDTTLEEMLRALRAFRVEVTLEPDSEGVEDELAARGFERSGPRRFVASVAQDEKIALVNRLMREHGDALADLSVIPVDDLSTAATATARPRLKVVGS